MSHLLLDSQHRSCGQRKGREIMRSLWCPEERREGGGGHSCSPYAIFFISMMRRTVHEIVMTDSIRRPVQ